MRQELSRQIINMEEHHPAGAADEVERRPRCSSDSMSGAFSEKEYILQAILDRLATVHLAAPRRSSLTATSGT